MDTLPILAAVVIQYQALTAPVLVPVVASTVGGGSSPCTRTPLVQYSELHAPVLVPSQVVSPVSSGVAVYPSLVPPKRRLHASEHQAFFFDRFAAPTVVPAPDLAYAPSTWIPRRKVSRAHLEPGHPEFGIEVRVPVMSWTGHYPDRHPQWRRVSHARHMPHLFWDEVLFPDVVVAPDMAQPVYPDRIHRTPKQRDYSRTFWPAFVADTTVTAPALSWQPEYADRVWPKRGLRTAAQQALAYLTDPIEFVAVSDVHGPHRFRVPAHNRKFRVPPHKRRFTR